MRLTCLGPSASGSPRPKDVFRQSPQNLLKQAFQEFWWTTLAYFILAPWLPLGRDAFERQSVGAPGLIPEGVFCNKQVFFIVDRLNMK